VNDLVDMPPPLLITNISFFEGCGRGQEFPRTVTPPGAVRPFAPVVCSARSRRLRSSSSRTRRPSARAARLFPDLVATIATTRITCACAATGRRL